MPKGAMTSRNARKCSGSLSAMTPSKSNTIAFSIETQNSKILLFHAFAGTDRQFQLVFGRRDRAGVARVVVAVRKVRLVEIELVDVVPGPIEIEEAAGEVRLRAVGEIAERDEQSIVGPGRRRNERRQLQRLTLQDELEHPCAPERIGAAHRQRNLDDGS